MPTYHDAKVDDKSLFIRARGASVDATSIIHAARNVTGTKHLVFGPGVHLVSGLKANVVDQVWEMMPGAEIKLTDAAAAPAIEILANGVTILNGTINGNRATQSSSSAMGIALQGTLDDVTIRGVEVRDCYGDAIRCNSNFVAARMRRLRVEDCYIHDCERSGITVQGFPDSEAIHIVNNIIDAVALSTAGVGIQVYATSQRYTEVHIIGNTVRDLGATGIPIEITGSTGVHITGNLVAGVGTRGISMGTLINVSVTGNTIRNQTTYGMEINVLTKATIVGNTIDDCAAGISGQGGSDIIIVGNTIANTDVANANPHGVFSQIVVTHRLMVVGNTFLNIAGQGVRVTMPGEDIVVSNNRFIWEVGAPLVGALVAVAIYGWIRGVVDNNEIRSAVPGTGGNIVGLIYHSSGESTNLRVRGNRIASTSGGILAVAGIYTAGVGATGMVIEDNECISLDTGIRTVGATGDTITIRENRCETCTTPENLKATHLRRTRMELEGTAAPVAGTWRQGDVVWNSAPAAGGVPGWLCTVAGTPGTWKAMANLAA
jgi:hypothetical protein